MVKDNQNLEKLGHEMSGQRKKEKVKERSREQKREANYQKKNLELQRNKSMASVKKKPNNQDLKNELSERSPSRVSNPVSQSRQLSRKRNAEKLNNQIDLYRVRTKRNLSQNTKGDNHALKS